MLKDFLQQVEEAIHGGVVSLESLHKQISEAIFHELLKIDAISNQVQELKESHDRLIADLYQLVRNANAQGAEALRSVVEKWEKPQN